MAAKRASTQKAQAPGIEPGPKPKRKPLPPTPNKRTPECRQSLIDAIGKYGLSDKSACDYAGISHQTFYVWIKEDVDLLEAINRARAEFKAIHCANIIKHAAQDWKASGWLLSHRFPEDFAERQMVDAAVTPCPLDQLFDPIPAPGALPDDTPDS